MGDFLRDTGEKAELAGVNDGAKDGADEVAGVVGLAVGLAVGPSRSAAVLQG